jgi:hypothetical protein
MAKLEMYRGDYREYTATVTDTYDAAAEVHFAVKAKGDVDSVDASDQAALFTVDADSTNAVDNGDGTVTYTVVIDEAKTTGKTPGKYKAEIEYVDGDGHKTTYDQLDFILKGDINQRT